MKGSGRGPVHEGFLMSTTPSILSCKAYSSDDFQHFPRCSGTTRMATMLELRDYPDD